MVNIFPPGSLLIHCYDGGRRSVTVAALFIWYRVFVEAGTKTFEEV